MTTNIGKRTPKQNTMENTNNPYDGLTISESIKKYYERSYETITQWESPLYEAVRQAIIERTKYFDPNKLCDGESYHARLPFAIRLEDENDESIERYYIAVEAKRELAYLIRYDEEDKEEKRHLFNDDTILRVYSYLERMGFFDKQYEEDFSN